MKSLFLNRLVCVALAFLAVACNFEKDITIDLPPHNSQFVVECYLEKGKPFRMLLTESSSYFDTLAETTIKRATVVISDGRRRDTLKYNPMYDLEYSKLYNFRNLRNLLPDTQAIYTLEVTDEKGRKMTGATRFLPTPKIDSIRWVFRTPSDPKDSAVSLRIWVKDAPQVENYYRLIVNVDSLDGGSNLDISLQDKLFDGKSFPIGTSFRFKQNDTVNFRLYNIEKSYYDFLESVEDAQRSNGNPFVQPASAKSMVQGGFGTFTTLSGTQRQVILTR
jgi:hypothetical protein